MVACLVPDFGRDVVALSPVIMTHGWPGSVIELLEVVGPLTDPTALAEAGRLGLARLKRDLHH